MKNSLFDKEGQYKVLGNQNMNVLPDVGLNEVESISVGSGLDNAIRLSEFLALV